MKRHSSTTAVLALAVLVFWALPVRSEFTCNEGLQASGSIYRICVPTDVPYNGRLVIWSHGFQDAGTPVSIPEDQLSFGGTSIPEIATSLGFGFATNSYSKTGLAVVQGIDDIVDLVDIYVDTLGTPEKIYVAGASEGGLITAKLLEMFPAMFDGGFSMCGPIGDFPLQINYFGDSRVTFDYFFPGLIPGEIFDPPQWLVDDWKNYYESFVKPVVFDAANRNKLDQWVRVARLPFDSSDYLDTVGVSVRDVLRYAVVNAKDAEQTLGGFPYRNRGKWYRGSDNDLWLNILVRRFDADRAAVAEMEAEYTTTGRLDKPLVTMHTLRDQQVPYVHEMLYNLKTLKKGSLLSRHVNIPVNRFEHCNFSLGDVVLGVALTLLYADDLSVLKGVGSVLHGDRLEAFTRLANIYGLPYRLDGDRLEVERD